MRFRTTRRTVLSAVLVLVSGRGKTHASPTTQVSNPNNVPILSDDMMGQVGASIMGESALVDKETGRVLWEGGTTTLSASLAPILGYGIKHARATLLTGLLLLALVGSIVARIRRSLFAPDASSTDSRSWPMTALLFVADWTILRVPQVNVNLLIAATVLYLLESYTCSTRRYLANALSSPVEVEEYIERLREEPPVVTWKVRCFHYERRKWLSILSYLSVIVKFLTMKRAEQQVDDLVQSSVQPSPRIFTRKVVTHQAVSNYNYTSVEDKTIAGVWRRAEATAASPAPFSKIVLSKLLILPSSKARDDYFKQQSTFVTREGSDEYTEFSTSIQVKGFRRRMLAVRPVEGVPSTKLFRQHLFWIFTFIGLTVPYRIWFARHCDELRVTVAKETASGKTGSSSWSWFSKSASKQSTEWNKGFKSKMRELALYAKGDALIKSKNETKAELPSPTEEEHVVSEVEAVATNETSTEVIVVVDTNATETKTKSGDGTTEKEQSEPPPPPPPPPPTKEEEMEATDKQGLINETSHSDKVQ